MSDWEGYDRVRVDSTWSRLEKNNKQIQIYIGTYIASSNFVLDPEQKQSTWDATATLYARCGE